MLDLPMTEHSTKSRISGQYLSGMVVSGRSSRRRPQKGPEASIAADAEHQYQVDVERYDRIENVCTGYSLLGTELDQMRCKDMNI